MFFYEVIESCVQNGYILETSRVSLIAALAVLYSKAISEQEDFLKIMLDLLVARRQRFAGRRVVPLYNGLTIPDISNPNV